MYVLKSCILLLVIALTTAEVVNFKPCVNDADNCSIHEVRIDPCPQAASNLACNIRRRKPAKMSFDFTPKFDADSLEAHLTWVKSEDQELPLISLEKDACKSTSCPVKSGQQQTYTIDVPIESKFPTSAYTIKWVLKETGGKQCCFTTDIKVVR